MGIYLTPEFEEERQNARISNAILCKAAKAIFSGLPGDPLGNLPIKSDLACPEWEPETVHGQSFFSMMVKTSFSLICI